MFTKQCNTYKAQMESSDGHADGNGRCDNVASASFVAYRMNDQNQNECNERFDDESLARLKLRVNFCPTEVYWRTVRSDELWKTEPL